MNSMIYKDGYVYYSYIFDSLITYNLYGPYLDTIEEFYIRLPRMDKIDTSFQKIFSKTIKGYCVKLGCNESIYTENVDTSGLIVSKYSLSGEMVSNDFIAPSGYPSFAVATDQSGNMAFTGYTKTTGYLELITCVDTTCNSRYPTSVNNMATKDVWSIYPNPATDFITVHHNGNENLDFAITDITGRALVSGHLVGQYTPVKISDLSPGLYFINIDGGIVKFLKS